MARHIETQIPSRALLQALDDLEKVEQAPNYRVSMSLWHAPGWGTHKCSVCFGGAMLARVNGYDHRLNHSPADLPHEEQHVVYAMDLIRHSHRDMVKSGVETLRVPPAVAASAVEEAYFAVHNHNAPGALFTVYNANPYTFKEERYAIAQALDQRGY